MPQSLQDYYQGVGRAGRDGADAKIHLLFSPADVNIWKGIQRSRFGAPTLCLFRLVHLALTCRCRSPDASGNKDSQVTLHVAATLDVYCCNTRNNFKTKL